MLLLLLSLLATDEAFGYSAGAPVAACKHLTPQHQNYVSQPLDTTPFNVSVSSYSMYESDTVTVTIAGPSFKGFILQARPLESTQPVGTFVSTEHTVYTCGQGLFNAATHTWNNNPSTSVTLDWMAPFDMEGEIQFISSVVKQLDTFWVGIESPKVKIVKRSVGTSPSPTVTTKTTATDAIAITTATTTTTTTTTTTSTTPPATSSDVTTKDGSITKTPVSATKPGIYDGCLTMKGCFGYPTSCVDRNSCSMLVTYKRNSEGRFDFELMGKSNGYIAVGFSQDDQMGEDSVVECVNQEGILEVFKSYNLADTNKRLPQSEQKGVSAVEGSVVDGVITCSFTLQGRVTARNLTFNINDNKYFLFIAAGYARKDNIGFHTLGKAKSSEPIALPRIEAVVPDQELLVRLHGSLMIGAWIGTASIGMLLARYYKQTWVGRKLFKKDMWFVWHRNFMVLTWLLTNAGFIIIFLELQQWMKGKYPQHAILGCVTTGLCFIQPFMAMLRPHPTATYRSLFNWLHWLVGNGAQIVAIVTIFYAVDLGKAKLPQWTDWILVAFVGFYVIMHLILSIQQCTSYKSDKKQKEMFMLREMNVNKGHRPPYFDETKSSDAPNSGCRKFALGVYMFVTILFAAVLILMVVFAPIEDKLTQWIGWPK